MSEKRVFQPSLELGRLSDSSSREASVLHSSLVMEALVLTAAMTVSGLIAIASTRAVLGVVMLVITRDAVSR